MRLLFSIIGASLATVGAITSDVTNTESVTVSGISAGAFFASQFHVAFSSRVEGVGILAGGPFYCAMDSVSLAEGRCMRYPSDINVDELVTITKSTYSTTGSIDNPANMANDKIWLFSAMNDTVVETGVVDAVAEYYENFVDESSQIEAIYDVIGEHSFITEDQGSECTYKGEPYINACNFDAAGSILTHLIPNIQEPNGQNNGLDVGSLLTFDQTAFLEVGYTSTTSSMNKDGYIYVPTVCQDDNTTCTLHVAFHGCEQTVDDIGEQFVLETGFNDWAGANNMIILYPQIVKTTMNPDGCFDWWGYTGTDYASKVGVQMNAVNGMINSISTLIKL